MWGKGCGDAKQCAEDRHESARQGWGITRLLLPPKRAWPIWDGPEALKLGEVPSFWPSLLPGRRALGGVRGCTGGSPGCT